MVSGEGAGVEGVNEGLGRGALAAAAADVSAGAAAGVVVATSAVVVAGAGVEIFASVDAVMVPDIGDTAPLLSYADTVKEYEAEGLRPALSYFWAEVVLMSFPFRYIRYPAMPFGS